jgi:hypothetical protein
MPAKKPLKWTGKFSDQQAGKYHVWKAAGAWILSHAGTQISQHASKEQAKRKAAEHRKRLQNQGGRDEARQARIRARTRKASTVAATARAELTHISTQTRHDVAASVARHDSLSNTRLTAAMPSARGPDAVTYPDVGCAAQLLASAGPAGVESALTRQRPGSADGERVRNAFEYEQARNAEPDSRDEEDREIARLILIARSELAEECTGPGVKRAYPVSTQ